MASASDGWISKHKTALGTSSDANAAGSVGLGGQWRSVRSAIGGTTGERSAAHPPSEVPDHKTGLSARRFWFDPSATKPADDPAVKKGVLEYRRAQLELLRAYRQGGKYAEADALVKEVMGAPEKPGWAITSVDFMMRDSMVHQLDTDLWDQTMAVNVRGYMLCAKYAIPSMQQRGGGAVINMASVQSFISQAKVAAYTTSKTALLGLTRSIAIDYAPLIRCVAVCPGTVDTPMLHWAINQSPDPAAVLKECYAIHPMQRIARPEEIADMVIFLASDNAGFVTGQYVRIDGGLGISVGGSKRDT